MVPVDKTLFFLSVLTTGTILVVALLLSIFFSASVIIIKLLSGHEHRLWTFVLKNDKHCIVL